MSRIISPNTMYWLLYGEYTFMQMGLLKVSKTRNKLGQIEVTITVHSEYEDELEKILSAIED